MSEPNSNAWPFTEISGEEGLDIKIMYNKLRKLKIA